jgi:ABC-type transport system substrate-binding protein
MFRSASPDPTAMLTFKILPAHLADDESFAQRPVGSGPFIYGGIVTEGGRKYAVFPANPQYSQRQNRGTLPQLKEVRFLAGTDPLEDFRKGLVDVMIESRTKQLAGPTPQPTPGSDVLSRLESSLGPTARVITRPSRRIVYLAVNPLKTALASDAGTKLRRSIAFGIQREVILNAVWRVEGQPNHRALTGPFPTGSWPCEPEMPTLDDKTLAAAELRTSPPPKDAMTLIYPNDDALAGPSCQRIQEQLKELGFTIESKGLPVAEFARALSDRAYDLEYRSFDFVNDWFDPKNLFAYDQAGTAGGGNGATRLESALARSNGRGEFSALREARRRLHREFREVMPFIPLWSPDLHVVIRKAVEPAPAAERLDPHAPFAAIDRWRVNR